ncbi:hypothetical protein [Enterobacter kobei]
MIVKIHSRGAGSGSGPVDSCWEKTVSESRPPYYGVILTVYAN